MPAFHYFFSFIIDRPSEDVPVDPVVSVAQTAVAGYSGRSNSGLPNLSISAASLYVLSRRSSHKSSHINHIISYLINKVHMNGP